MIKCSCGKELEHVPNWLGSVNVKVVCNNCPDRDLKSITEIKLESPEPVDNSKQEVSKDEIGEEDDEDED
ncbi:MAG: hypothetical protein KF824_12200 [Fimbriimonadaceae bacterium]|nr:MAG: hypothetical protein KF824_12200 [Fimbriimonadaceae bacterium]